MDQYGLSVDRAGWQGGGGSNHHLQMTTPARGQKLRGEGTDVAYWTAGSRLADSGDPRRPGIRSSHLKGNPGWNPFQNGAISVADSLGNSLSCPFPWGDDCWRGEVTDRVCPPEWERLNYWGRLDMTSK